MKTRKYGAGRVGVIDIFAGPGGLSEGFHQTRAPSGSKPFRSAVSVEMHPAAHSTLTFRTFCRELADQIGTLEAGRILSGISQIQVPELYSRFPSQAQLARNNALQLRLGSDSRRAAIAQIADRIGGFEETILIGGPPCQAYSLMGRSRNRGVRGYTLENDERAELYVEYLHILEEFQPAAFVMENVKGLLSTRLHGTSLFARILEDLSAPSTALFGAQAARRRRKKYRLISLVDGVEASFHDALDAHRFVIRSENYGIPQSRHRVILLGVREDIPLSGKTLALSGSSPTTVEETIGWLPRLRSGLSSQADSNDAWLREIKEQIVSVRSALRRNDPLRERLESLLYSTSAPRLGRGGESVPATRGGKRMLVSSHQTRSHMSSDLGRYLFCSSFALEHGKSPTLEHFPATLRPSHRSARSGEAFADRFRVQVRTRPASTITSHIAKDGHYYIHPDPSQARSLTVREAALLQTFPVDYMFLGNRTEQYAQVGNAVPPALAKQIAEKVASLL